MKIKELDFGGIDLSELDNEEAKLIYNALKDNYNLPIYLKNFKIADEFVPYCLTNVYLGADNHYYVKIMDKGFNIGIDEDGNYQAFVRNDSLYLVNFGEADTSKSYYVLDKDLFNGYYYIMIYDVGNDYTMNCNLFVNGEFNSSTKYIDIDDLGDGLQFYIEERNRLSPKLYACKENSLIYIYKQM